jgi:hypothetical protein
MSLTTPEKIQTLQRKLCLKAKRDLRDAGSRESHRGLATSRTPSEEAWSESRVRAIRTPGSTSGGRKRGHGRD